MLTACAGPSQRFDRLAESFGLVRSEVKGGSFHHALFRKKRMTTGGRLHAYIGGDGVPWIAGRWLAADPTPGDAIALRLMAMDPQPSVYIGRPCYHGSGPEDACDPGLWSHARYSSRVVDSLQQALEKLLHEGGYSELVLIGYSGGGTLAMLLAQRVSSVRVVVSVAGNLDPDAWTVHHRYLPLTGSLNPDSLPPLGGGVRQLHLIGGRDINVPPMMTRAALQGRQGVHIVEWPDFDHGCCWERVWPQVLACMDTGCEDLLLPAVQ